MKILESYKKMAKSMLIEYAWDRKFGEPLPTLEDVMREAEEVDPDKVIGKNDDDKDITVKQAMDYSGDNETMNTLKKKAQDLKSNGGEEEPKSKGLGKGDFERDFDDSEPEDKPFGGDTGADPDPTRGDPDDSWDDEEGRAKPKDEPEGGEQNIPSDDEIDSYQEKLNTYTGPYSDGNEIHTKWEGITAKVWAETSEEAYTDEPDHPLNKPSDSKWADTVGEEVRALATAHFSEFGDELKDASPEAKAYFKEKGLPPSDEEDGKEESITINGQKYRPIKESKESNSRVLKEIYDRTFRSLK